MDERDGETYTFVRNIWKEPPRFVDEDVGPVAFLVHNTSKITVIVCPGCRGLSAETLNTAEGRVLDDDYTHGSLETLTPDERMSRISRSLSGSSVTMKIVPFNIMTLSNIDHPKKPEVVKES